MNPPRTVVVDSIRRVERGSLRGFATVTIAEKLKIHSIRIIQETGKAVWVSLPQTEVKSPDAGKTKYFPVIEVLDETLKRQIVESVIAAYMGGQR